MKEEKYDVELLARYAELSLKELRELKDLIDYIYYQRTAPMSKENHDEIVNRFRRLENQ